MKRIIFLCLLSATCCFAEKITIRPSNDNLIALDADIIFEKNSDELSIGVLLSPSNPIFLQQIDLEQTAVIASHKKFVLPGKRADSHAGGKILIWLTPLPGSYHADILNANSLVLLIPTKHGEGVKAGFNHDELEQIKEVIVGAKPTRWKNHTEIDDITDKPIAYAILEASNTIPNSIGTPVTPLLVIRCKNAKTDAYVKFQRFITTEETQVTTRVGAQSAKTAIWEMATDYKSAFSPRPLTFARSLTQGDKLLIQVTPYGDNPIKALFDTTGARRALRNIRRLCAW